MSKEKKKKPSSRRLSEHDHMNAHLCKDGKIGYWYPCSECGK